MRAVFWAVTDTGNRQISFENSAATGCLNSKPGKTTCFYGSISGSCFLLSVEGCNWMELEIIPLPEYSSFRIWLVLSIFQQQSFQLLVVCKCGHVFTLLSTAAHFMEIRVALLCSNLLMRSQHFLCVAPLPGAEWVGIMSDNFSLFLLLFLALVSDRESY